MAVARLPWCYDRGVPLSTYVVPRWYSLANPILNPNPHTRPQRGVAGKWL